MTPQSIFLTLCLGTACLIHGQAPPADPALQARLAKKGAGDLMVLPTRVVLEGRDRAAEVVIKNDGTEKTTYRVNFKEMEMTKEGRLQDRQRVPGEITAQDMVRFSPRQVDLEPGETQSIRLQLRKPENLPDGEYRSHVLFQAVPNAKPPAPLGEAVEKSLSISIRTTVGISIPIIVRHGDVQAVLKISGLRFWQPDGQGKVVAPIISLNLERVGNRSVLGDFVVTVEAGGKLKKGTVLYENKGVAVYQNLALREVHMPMWQAANGDLAGARIKVTFTPTDMKGAPVEAFLDMPMELPPPQPIK